MERKVPTKIYKLLAKELPEADNNYLVEKSWEIQNELFSWNENNSFSIEDIIILDGDITIITSIGKGKVPKIFATSKNIGSELNEVKKSNKTIKTPKINTTKVAKELKKQECFRSQPIEYEQVIISNTMKAKSDNKLSYKEALEKVKKKSISISVEKEETGEVLEIRKSNIKPVVIPTKRKKKKDSLILNILKLIGYGFIAGIIYVFNKITGK